MESVLPPEVARKLLHKDLANLVKRVHEGKKLTRSEHAMLQNLAGMSAGHSGPTHARNFVELAEILGVSRQALGHWRRRRDAPNAAAKIKPPAQTSQRGLGGLRAKTTRPKPWRRLASAAKPQWGGWRLYRRRAGFFTPAERLRRAYPAPCTRAHRARSSSVPTPLPLCAGNSPMANSGVAPSM